MPVDPVAIFLSSPSDVPAERERGKAVCRKLQAEPAISQRFRLDACVFENTLPPVIGEAPQEPVDRYLLQPHDADVLICVLWGSLGSPYRDPSRQTSRPSTSSSK